MLVNSPINLMVVWDMNSLNIGSRYVLAVMKIIKAYFLVWTLESYSLNTEETEPSN